MIAYYHNESGSWYYRNLDEGENDELAYPPTHWMPLPELPK